MKIIEKEEEERLIRAYEKKLRGESPDEEKSDDELEGGGKTPGIKTPAKSPSGGASL